MSFVMDTVVVVVVLVVVLVLRPESSCYFFFHVIAINISIFSLGKGINCGCMFPDTHNHIQAEGKHRDTPHTCT